MNLLKMLLQLFLVAAVQVSPQIISVDEEEGPLDEPDLTPSNLQNRQCNKKLGMESGDIADDSLSVSAKVPGLSYGKEHARLNGASAWVTYAKPEQWIEVDLGKLMYVSGVQTQGQVIARFGYQLWVSAYKVLYKEYPRQSNWLAVSEGIGGGPLVFDGNTDTNTIATTVFQEPVQAQIIRIVPMAWIPNRTKMALRLELIGCNINTQSGCGGPKILTNPSGFVASMNHPNNYDNNANCRWDITAPRGQTIVLTFADRFALEASPNNCRLEYVEILDVIGQTEQSLGKFCGKKQPGKFISTYNKLKVRFMTDHYEAYSGFRATYQFVNGSGCGGPQILRDSSGSIHSMNYPQNYYNNGNCLWDIFTDSDKLIELKFTDMQINKGFLNNCMDDSVQIINIGKGVREGRFRAVQRYCGRKIPKNFVSASNQLRIVFRSNGRSTDKGFNATYTAVPASGCGGKRDLSERTGTIHSLNYPYRYTNGLKCEWNIKANQNEDIKIKFSDIDLEEHSDCEYDHISIYDGSSQRHLLGKYCNKLNLQPLIAHSGVMKVIFVSDMYNPRSGFEASYVIVPQATLMIPTTAILQRTTAIMISTEGQGEEKTTQGPVDPQTTLHEQIPQETSTNSTQTSTARNTMETIKQKDFTTTRQQSAVKPSPEIVNTVVTGEMAKWILIGLASVAGLLIVLVLFGMVMCCRQTFSRSNVSMQGSIKNGSTGVMQNHAYDFSIASTNHSVRSRQVELPESSQVSESFSHQGTLRHAPSRDSHIYFSIDDYCSKKKNAPGASSSKPAEPANTKVHFVKHRQGSSSHANIGSDGSATTVHSDEDEYYEDEEEECSVFNGDSEKEGWSKSAFTSKEGPKMMVANILYESADSVE